MINKFYFLMLIVCFPILAKTQSYIFIDFENPVMYQNKLVIDTQNYPNNKWQIGLPSKAIFDSANSPVHALVTDTLNTLPPSDTSVFVLKQYRPYPFGIGSFVIGNFGFLYKLHKDSTDLAKVELLADTGNHWINLMTQDTAFNMTWMSSGKPNFQDTSTAWKYFHCNYSQWFSANYSSGFYPYYADADTFRYRFTFISSSTSVNKEGWMIDDINILFGIGESSNSLVNTQSILFYPNPNHTKQLHLKRAHDLLGMPEKITIYSFDGRMVLHQILHHENQMAIPLQPGNYVLKYESGDTILSEKLIVE
ncbi:MAG: T9SS type A sorting domain-containing protein [Bacteroidetes bacterium]|nr:T9SS type A sorting domain-containing protein [Bacteroidota bacterium]